MVVASRSDFDDFYRQLRATDRKPVVAISIANGSHQPGIDVSLLEKELGDAVDYFVLEENATFWLTDALGSRHLSVHSGWVRIYPADPGWVDGTVMAPNLRPSMANRRLFAERVVASALEILFQAQRFERSEIAPNSRSMEVRVTGVASATEILVEGERRQVGVMRSHQLWPGIPADRLVVKGQTLLGSFEEKGLLGEFMPRGIEDEIENRVRGIIGDGAIVLARVEMIESDRVGLLLHPRFRIDVTSDGSMNMGTLVSLDDVIAVEVVDIDGELTAAFSDDEPTCSISVIPDGPPWLVTEDMERPALGTAIGGDADHISEDSLEPHLTPAEESLLGELEQVEMEREALKRELRELKAQLRRASKLSIPRVFDDLERQFRWELELEYLVNIPEADRERYPFDASFVLGPTFLESVDRLVATGSISREKILEVCVEVVCGLARIKPNRGVKEWTESKGGSQIVRTNDGARAMRVRLQQGTAGARRMKYWKLATGAIEFESVGVHDDGIRA